jgi:hypothetical protein
MAEQDCPECEGSGWSTHHGRPQPCTRGCAEPDVPLEPRDPNDCAECARSYGPHYTGPCAHGER